MLRNHDTLFVACQEREFNCIVAYVMYERILGTESFFHAYFDANEVGQNACFWKQEALDMIDDKELTRDLENYKKSIETEWEKMQKVMSDYPDLYPEDKTTYELY